MENVDLAGIKFFIMSIWREREHEREEREMFTDIATLLVLRRCGLLKYARLELMRGQEDLLRWIIQQWDDRQHVFHIGGNELSIEKDDIYFLTSLSCHGPRPNLTGSRADPRTTANLICTHCIQDTEVVSNGVPIAQVASIPLRSLLWMIVDLARAKSQHVATKAQLLLALNCMQPQVFYWCEGVVCWVRAELKACKT